MLDVRCEEVDHELHPTAGGVVTVSGGSAGHDVGERCVRSDSEENEENEENEMSTTPLIRSILGDAGREYVPGAAEVDRRHVDPPIKAETARWARAGLLDWWVKERREWWIAYAVQTAVNGGSKPLIFVPRAARSHNSSWSSIAAGFGTMPPSSSALMWAPSDGALVPRPWVGRHLVQFGH